uniref:NIPA like domain containing 2 n=1 Tax=Cyprinus carpio TaxID=7962 RepID=A0A8C1Z082_CYPCA
MFLNHPYWSWRNNSANGVLGMRTVYIVGICIAVCGNFLISISLNIQKYTHVRQSQRETKPYYTSRLWWCGILLMGLGELGNFAAYGFAPASLIAPLGCVSVIMSVVISVVFLKETLRASDILGGALALTGTYFLVTFAPRSSPHVTANMVERSLVSWTFLIYFVSHFTEGSITFRCERSFASYPIFYIMFIIMVTSCAFQIKFLNQAMKMFDATEIVPINYVFFTASAVVAGILFYEEFYGLSLIYYIMFAIGCLLAFTGVFLIARARPRIKMDRVFSMGQIPGKSCTDKMQPQSDDSKYGKLGSKLTCNSGIQQDEP